MHASGSSSRAAAAPGAVHWPAVVRVGALSVSPLSPASGCSARRRLPSRGSRGPQFPTCSAGGSSPRPSVLCAAKTAILPLSGHFAGGSLPDPWPAPLLCVPLPAPRPAAATCQRQGSWSAGTPPLPALWARRPLALPSSRVPPVTAGPALRPRWYPARLAKARPGWLPSARGTASALASRPRREVILPSTTRHLSGL